MKSIIIITYIAWLLFGINSVFVHGRESIRTMYDVRNEIIVAHDMAMEYFQAD